MRLLLLIITLSCLHITSSALILTSKETDRLADNYAKGVALESRSWSTQILRHECDPQENESCVKVLCEKTGSCSFQHNMQEIVSSCRGASGKCVAEICERTGSCSFMHNAKEAASACKSSNGACVEVGCEKTGACSFMHNAKEIATACIGVLDTECVQYACEQSGSCSFLHNFVSIAKSCAGR